MPPSKASLVESIHTELSRLGVSETTWREGFITKFHNTMTLHPWRTFEAFALESIWEQLIETEGKNVSSLWTLAPLPDTVSGDQTPEVSQCLRLQPEWFAYFGLSSTGEELSPSVKEIKRTRDGKPGEPEADSSASLRSFPPGVSSERHSRTPGRRERN